ncbi:MAG: DUF4259 domain-containing protein [Acidobacteriota bacterium]
MGSWGLGAFENDTALDWAHELETVDDVALLKDTFEGVLALGADYLDADLAQEGLAACEVVARLKGQWGERSEATQVVDTWIDTQRRKPATTLVNKALAVIDRITAPPCELLEEWDEQGSLQDWIDGVEELRARIAR